ncbi:MAG: transcriptional repressor NrdR [Ruminococcus sp.]|jgi:transcriptional repressor NrdR|nr:transcriptional repressor NrdR [Ruminococcus sp.]MBQ3947785.1 transcriptional repressor NrdR [Ruminococcus sp.]
MKCPYCGFDDSKVIDSRPTDDKIRRRRECIKCSGRFTTYEAIEIPLLMVEKRSGGFEQFDKQKLIKGIFTAIKKRPVTKAQVDDIADYVENYCADRLKTVIKSEEIGNIVLDRLREIDPISYIRFASVYKDFTDIASFVAVISEFDENKAN